MTPEKLFHELLGLGMNWEVVECEYDRVEGVVRLAIRETEQLWRVERSPEVGAAVSCYDHTEELTWRHLNVFEHRCEIRCRLPRARCSQSGKVYRVKPPWEGLSKHFTKAFEVMALMLMREMPMGVLARQLKETDTRLWRMLKRHVAAAHPMMDWSEVYCVGCDEMSVRKGHHYISVFCDLVGRRVLLAVPGKDKSVWERFARALEEHHSHPRAIAEASMDMSKAYIAGVRENCGDQTQIVFDKFHVMAHVNQAVIDVRQAELRLGRGINREVLKQTRWMLRKNPQNHNEKEQRQWQRLERQNLLTAKAYQMRLNLQDIYLLDDAFRARRRLLAWCRWVRRVAAKHPSQLFRAMLKASEMVQRHLEGILAHWKRRTTNAFMEALNSVFSATKRRARGYRSTDNLITMLYFVAGKLRLPAH
jgi:transposase